MQQVLFDCLDCQPLSTPGVTAPPLQLFVSPQQTAQQQITCTHTTETAPLHRTCPAQQHLQTAAQCQPDQQVGSHPKPSALSLREQVPAKSMQAVRWPEQVVNCIKLSFRGKGSSSDHCFVVQGCAREQVFKVCVACSMPYSVLPVAVDRHVAASHRFLKHTIHLLECSLLKAFPGLKAT